MSLNLEAGRKIEILPPRTEIGFFVDEMETEHIKQKLVQLGYSPLRFPTPYVQTIYFTEIDGNAPKNGYLRLRSYNKQCVDELQLANRQSHYLEGKVGGGTKERIELPLEICLQILMQPEFRVYLREVVPEIYKLLSEVGPLIPVAATECLRTHHVLDENNRATIDTQQKYFAFVPGYQTGKLMGKIDRNRLEFKNNHIAPPIAEFLDFHMEQIPPKQHEKTIRSMYINFISSLQKQQ